ncbi:hypothetical protein ACFUJR_19020, partial [Streptomyces sp. NPDC057271]|uniref:hypothetical protein n=1 Tax=Streptomyces sp. NPDC057271 TaxID=3346078 RepID=UPI003633BAEA
ARCSGRAAPGGRRRPVPPVAQAQRDGPRREGADAGWEDVRALAAWDGQATDVPALSGREGTYGLPGARSAFRGRL